MLYVGGALERELVGFLLITSTINLKWVQKGKKSVTILPLSIENSKGNKIVNLQFKFDKKAHQKRVLSVIL